MTDGELHSDAFVHRAFAAYLGLETAKVVHEYLDYNAGTPTRGHFDGNGKEISDSPELHREIAQERFDRARGKLDITQTSELLALILTYGSDA